LHQKLFINANLASMMPGDTPYGLIENGAIAISKGTIEWCGLQNDLPSQYSGWESQNLEGRVVTPGLIDCHTHIVHGGNRANEFERRLEGASYEEVARAGGGIISTVKATRSTSEEDLVEKALPHIDALAGEGVCTIEIKSGYGLDQENELKMLRAARQIAHRREVSISTSFLGAHAVPAEYKDNADAYIDNVCIPALKAAHREGLADAVDGFCEGIAFSPEQIERVFIEAKALGIPIKLHAEQLSNLGGAVLAAKYNGLSADHLEYLDEAGVVAMADAGVIATILPGAFYTLHETQYPPVDLLRKHKVPIAIATDCNPGSSPLSSILLTMNMACTLFRLTPREALTGVTRNAAQALGYNDRGTLEAGKRADLAIWDIEHPGELSYRIGFNPLYQRIFGGAL
jgi:imidazolonepropionase